MIVCHKFPYVDYEMFIMHLSNQFLQTCSDPRRFRTIVKAQDCYLLSLHVVIHVSFRPLECLKLPPTFAELTPNYPSYVTTRIVATFQFDQSQNAQTQNVYMYEVQR